MHSSIHTELYGNEQSRKQSAHMRYIYTKFVGETQSAVERYLSSTAPALDSLLWVATVKLLDPLLHRDL